ncbi:MAG: response regulator [Pseudomonadota bacterium]
MPDTNVERQLRIANNKLNRRIALLEETLLEKKRAGEALQDSEKRYRRLFESAKDGILILDADTGKVVDVNPFLLQLLGYSYDALYGQHIWELGVFKDIAASKEAFKILQDNEYIRYDDLPLETLAGKPIAVEFVSNVYLVDQRKVIQCNIRDISERKQADNAIRIERAKLTAALENMDFGVIICNTQGADIWMNAAALRFHDFSTAADLLVHIDQYRNEWELCYPDGRIMPFDEWPLPRAIRGDYVRDYEAHLCHLKSNLERDGCYTCVPVRNEGSKIAHIVITLQNTTKHKQADRDRIARQAAEEASRAKSAFVANMSHEIRTPLNAILGFAQVLERDLSLTPRQAEHVRTISRSGAHLLKLINDILDMSKIEAGGATLNEASFCLYNFLDGLEMMFRSRTDAKKLQLLMERDENLPRYVTADEGKLRQILVNLMGNAVNFTETGGVAVRVRVEMVEGKIVGDKHALRLQAEVEDTGPGISDEDMSRLFGAFQQAEAGLKVGGTGLGLAISSSFVEMMGGKLTVTSQVGKGSCFRFEVLIASADGVVEQEKSALRSVVGLEPGAGPFRILVVDDMPENRSLVCELLRPVGFEVAEASNGVEAIDIFERWLPHAVIMDMRMPVMDGYEATRRLKATEAGRATPVIAVTASAFKDQEAHVLVTGVAAYLSKPFRPEELFDVLGKSLGLSYVFADEADKFPSHLKPSPLKLESLAELPFELIQAMRLDVAEGDMAHLTELIAQVEKVDSNVARVLQALANRYEYEVLSRWLEKGGADNE